MTGDVRRLPELHRRAAARLMARARRELRADGGMAAAAEVSVLLTRLDDGAELEPLLEEFDRVIAGYRPVVVPLLPPVVLVRL